MALLLQRTLLILKPDIISHEVEILNHLKQHGYKIVQRQRVFLTEEQATDFYQEHIDEPQFAKLVEFEDSGPIISLVTQKLSIFEEIPAFVGPRNPETGRSLNPGSLRAIYGKDELHNGIHYSEDPMSAKREIEFFFPETVIEPVSIETAKLVLESTVYPVLLQGLTLLCKEKPANPTEWLGQWLLDNNPSKPKIEHPN